MLITTNINTGRFYIINKIDETIPYRSCLISEENIVNFSDKYVNFLITNKVDCIDEEETLINHQSIYHFNILWGEPEKAIIQSLVYEILKSVCEKLCPPHKQINAAIKIYDSATTELIYKKIFIFREYSELLAGEINALQSFEDGFEYYENFCIKKSTLQIVNALNELSFSLYKEKIFYLKG